MLRHFAPHFSRVLEVLRVECRNSGPRFASTSNGRNKNIKYLVSSSGNPTHNLMRHTLVNGMLHTTGINSKIDFKYTMCIYYSIMWSWHINIKRQNYLIPRKRSSSDIQYRHVADLRWPYCFVTRRMFLILAQYYVILEVNAKYYWHLRFNISKAGYKIIPTCLSLKYCVAIFPQI